LAAQWLSSTNEVSSRVSGSLQSIAGELSRPSRQRQLRQLIMLLLILWLLFSLARLIWSFLPAEQAMPEIPGIINPVVKVEPQRSAADLDIGELRQWHLFGEVGEERLPLAQEEIAAPVATAREGIEKGARETRLQLRLRGVVASTEDGLGHAIIEHRNKQAVYAVEDKLPLSGEVVLAKVMPRQVVLDNGGNYELLTLFEETELDAQVSSQRPINRAPQNRSASVDKRGEAQATTLASGYRDRLYENPQSLADVVSVNAVRDNGELRGYRLSPGKDKAQFAQLGFKAGDLVTSVNGISLDDPANTMRLYQTMRTASEAVFEIERGDQPVSISVSLGESAGQGPAND
jgi:general secretion pathway protein C